MGLLIFSFVILLFSVPFALSTSVSSFTEVSHWGNNDCGTFIEPTSDNGLLILANSYDNDFGGVMLLKYDEDIILMWAKSIGGGYTDYPVTARETMDGGYIVVGDSEGEYMCPSNNSNDFRCSFYLKFDENGEMEWGMSIGNNKSDNYNYDVMETPDGMFTTAFRTSIYVENEEIRSEIIFSKIFKNGTLSSLTRIYHNSTNTNGSDLDIGTDCFSMTSDYGFLVCGSYFPSKEEFVFIARIHPNLTIDRIIRLKVINNTASLELLQIKETSDFGTIVSGDYEQNAFFAKFDENLEFEWSRIFYPLDMDSNYFYYDPKIIQSSDGGYVISGEISITLDVEEDIFLSKFNSSGGFEWIKFFGTEDEGMYYNPIHEIIYLIEEPNQEDGNKGYIFTGGSDYVSLFKSLYDQDLKYLEKSEREQSQGTSFDEALSYLTVSKIQEDGKGCLWKDIPTELSVDLNITKMNSIFFIKEDLNNSFLEIKNNQHLDDFNFTLIWLDTDPGEYYKDMIIFQNSSNALCYLPCPEGYYGEFCEIIDCFGELSNGSSYCSGNGDCDGYNYCVCSSIGKEKFSGEQCEFPSCFGIVANDTDDNICNSHGVCYGLNECNCYYGYYSSDPEEKKCDVWYCYGERKDSSNACSGRGVCSDLETCDCKDNYEGNYCETWSCGYDYKITHRACSGNGKCLGPSQCDCDFGFVGDLCDENILLSAVMAPILTIAGLSLIGIIALVLISTFFFIFLCVCCLIFFFCCSVVVLSLLICCLSTATIIYRFRVKKFSKLKNFDILLQEQEIEEDTSIAHLKLNRELFEVNYNEIKMEKVLGKGGSNSTVYLASWKGTKIAFKCFRTSDICSTQNSFDEFEREVQIMSSINHPNIVQFLGASLNPPRVGILMEFCENGEIVKYFLKFKKDRNGKIYPILEKLRMMLEISACLDYLHSRSIIHRDLKSENVLLDSKESCKLMDFGLSKLVFQSQARTTRIGTSIYMAPEIMKNTIYDEKCDVFSFAILVFVMITEKENPYKNYNVNSGVEFKVANDESFRPSVASFVRFIKKHFSEMDQQEYSFSEEFFEGFIAWLVDIITKCWKEDVDERYSMNQLSTKFKKKIEEIEKLKDGDVVKKKRKRKRKKDGDEKNIVYVDKFKENKESFGNGNKKERILELERIVKEIKVGNFELEEKIEKLSLENQELLRENKDLE